MGALSMFLLSGLWAGYSATPQPITDINNHALAVDDTVKLVCKIVSIDTSATHYNGIVVRPLHPEGNCELTTRCTYSVDPKQLLYGS